MTKDDQSNDINQDNPVNHDTHNKVSPKNNNMPKFIAAGVLGLIVLVLVFFSGMAIQNHQNKIHKISGISKRARMFGMGGPQFGGGRGYFGGQNTDQNAISLSGIVTSINGNDFSIDQSGTSKTIKTDSGTRFIGIGIGGLKSGDNVRVIGNLNSDNSIQAFVVNLVTNSNTSSINSSNNI